MECTDFSTGTPSINVKTLFRNAYQALEQLQFAPNRIGAIWRMIITCHRTTADLERLYRNQARIYGTDNLYDPHNLREILDAFITTCNSLTYVLNLDGGLSCSVGGRYLFGSRASWKDKQMKGLKEEFSYHQKTLSRVLITAVQTTTIEMQNINPTDQTVLDQILRLVKRKEAIQHDDVEGIKGSKQEKLAQIRAAEVDWEFCLRRYFEFAESWNYPGTMDLWSSFMGSMVQGVPPMVSPMVPSTTSNTLFRSSSLRKKKTQQALTHNTTAGANGATPYYDDQMGQIFKPTKAWSPFAGVTSTGQTPQGQIQRHRFSRNTIGQVVAAPADQRNVHMGNNNSITLKTENMSLKERKIFLKHTDEPSKDDFENLSPVDIQALSIRDDDAGRFPRREMNRTIGYERSNSLPTIRLVPPTTAEESEVGVQDIRPRPRPMKRNSTGAMSLGRRGAAKPHGYSPLSVIDEGPQDVDPQPSDAEPEPRKKSKVRFSMPDGNVLKGSTPSVPPIVDPDQAAVRVGSPVEPNTGIKRSAASSPSVDPKPTGLKSRVSQSPLSSIYKATKSAPHFLSSARKSPLPGLRQEKPVPPPKDRPISSSSSIKSALQQASQTGQSTVRIVAVEGGVEQQYEVWLKALPFIEGRI